MLGGGGVSDLHEAIGVGCDDGHIAGLRGGVVPGDVLLHCKVEHLLLRVRRGIRILADVLSFDLMRLDLERIYRGHREWYELRSPILELGDGTLKIAHVRCGGVRVRCE